MAAQELGRGGLQGRFPSSPTLGLGEGEKLIPSSVPCPVTALSPPAVTTVTTVTMNWLKDGAGPAGGQGGCVQTRLVQ